MWHDLLRDCAAAQLPKNQVKQINQAYLDHFTSVADQAKKFYLQRNQQILQSLELFDRECAHLEIAFELLKSESNHAKQLIRLVDDLASISLLRFHPRQRLQWLQAQSEAASWLGDLETESVALGNLGVSLFTSGKPGRAIENYEKRLSITRAIGDRLGEAHALGNLGNAYTVLGGMDKAIKYHEQSLWIARDIGDRIGEANTLGNLGIVYWYLGELSKAIDYYEQQLVITRDIGDMLNEGHALGGLGIAYKKMGEIQKAIGYYEQQQELARKFGDQVSEGNALWNSALAYENLGDLAKAIELAEQALAIREAIEDPNAAKVEKALAMWRIG